MRVPNDKVLGNYSTMHVKLDESLRIAVRHEIDDLALHAGVIDLRSWISEATRKTIYEFSMTLKGREVERTIEETTHVPLTWWDHFKKRWFPNWMLKRWPVQTRAINTVIRRVHCAPVDSNHVTFLTKDLQP